VGLTLATGADFNLHNCHIADLETIYRRVSAYQEPSVLIIVSILGVLVIHTWCMFLTKSRQKTSF
jgi:hypothetical protein